MWTMKRSASCLSFIDALGSSSMARNRQRGDRVALRRRRVVFAAGDGDIMPGGGSLLPERVRVGAHVVGPGRGFVEALGAEQQPDVGARLGAEAAVGDGGD